MAVSGPPFFPDKFLFFSVEKKGKEKKKKKKKSMNAFERVRCECGFSGQLKKRGRGRGREAWWPFLQRGKNVSPCSNHEH